MSAMNKTPFGNADNNSAKKSGPAKVVSISSKRPVSQPQNASKPAPSKPNSGRTAGVVRFLRSAGQGTGATNSERSGVNMPHPSAQHRPTY